MSTECIHGVSYRLQEPCEHCAEDRRLESEQVRAQWELNDAAVEIERLKKALADAQQSLRTIADQAGRDAFLKHNDPMEEAKAMFGDDRVIGLARYMR